MWLICEPLRCVLASEDLSWESMRPPEDEAALWAMSSGKPTQRAFSWRGWRTRPWSQHLFGAATLPSCHLSRLLGEWISSLPVSRVSRSALPESRREPTTSDGSGEILRESFATLGRDGCSWKTSAACLPEMGSERSSVRWPTSGSMRSGRCFERPMLERHTDASGCSSWPTSGGNDWKGTATKGQRRGQLDEAAEQKWLGAGLPDPTTEPHGPQSSINAPTSRRHYQTPRTGKKGPPGCSARHGGQPAGQRLNPQFVEWLMGFPIGWSSARTGSDASATPSCHSRPPSHSQP